MTDSHVFRSTTTVASLAVSAVVVIQVLLISARPAEAQAPPPDTSTQSRPTGKSQKFIEPSTTSVWRHPLDPLQPGEVQLAIAAVRKDRQLSDSVRFVTVTLNEPSKEVVRHAKPGTPCSREAFLILLDNATGAGTRRWSTWARAQCDDMKHFPKAFSRRSCLTSSLIAKRRSGSSPIFREAMKKRGIDDVSLVMVDAWSAGHYGNEPPEDRGKRLVRALCWVRSEPHDNGYARPIENIVAVVDLNRKQVVRIEDYGVVPLPTQAGNWARAYVKERRHDLKPLDVSQPNGASFTVVGHEVTWQNWSFRVGFNPREGLVLYTVGYDGRPVLYRASIAEMMVPYADPKASSYHKNVFDLGEYGVGMMANSLALGCDCLGTIHYFDGHVCRQPGPGRHDQERDLPARRRFRHALEAYRLAYE